METFLFTSESGHPVKLSDAVLDACLETRTKSRRPALRHAPVLNACLETRTKPIVSFTSDSGLTGHSDKLCDQISDAILDACLEHDPDYKVVSETETRTKPTFLFAFESGLTGHRDKLCDQVSDAILDACLEQDPDRKVVCETETCTKTNMVMVKKATVDYEKIFPDACRSIGFISDDVGLNIDQQSPNIAQGVHCHFTKRPKDIGAGDQAPHELMPPSHVLATKIRARIAELRKKGTCRWLRPDGKTQVNVEYYKDSGVMVPVRVHTVLIDETVTNDEIARDLKAHVIRPIIPEKYFYDKTKIHLNPPGRSVLGVVDHKVSHAIGVPEPSLSVFFVDTYGTKKIPDKEILKIREREL
ncbi:hypothetical protein EUTSA_v10027815mg [Eutrema salsugineum]|uniref:methionine adenosyltransferase n=1 Tax=Eutrema salsugineum TaxID=72664 RepID=V4L940_EUTSA|nr:hypothetical protein EUTSA_v10027815mg [Eutrema salsugineum]